MLNKTKRLWWSRFKFWILGLLKGNVGYTLQKIARRANINIHTHFHTSTTFLNAQSIIRFLTAKQPIRLEHSSGKSNLAQTLIDWLWQYDLGQCHLMLNWTLLVLWQHWLVLLDESSGDEENQSDSSSDNTERSKFHSNRLQIKKWTHVSGLRWSSWIVLDDSALN